MAVLQSKSRYKDFNLDAEKDVSDSVRKQRRIYLEDMSEVADRKFEELTKTGASLAISFREKNPIVKAIRFLSVLDEKGIQLEFDTPNTSAYAHEQKYADHRKALFEHGEYGDLQDKNNKATKEIISNVSFVYMIQHCVVKIVENKPMIATRSGYVHMTDRDAVAEVMSNTALEEKYVNTLLSRFYSVLTPMLPTTAGSKLVSVPKSFDYFHYRFINGVLDARTGLFIEGDKTTQCMYYCEMKYQCSTKAEEIFERFVSYLATDENGVIDLEQRRKIIGFMLYPVCYNVTDKDISVLFGSGGNGKSVLGNLMGLAYGSIGVGKSYLNAVKKASGTYMNNEISSAFSKNTAFFDEETFSHIEQAEQMKHFIDQTISYEIRNLGASSVDLAIRGVVIFNSNTKGLLGASRANTWLTRRFTGLLFKFVFDQDPEAKAWIKESFRNVNGIYTHFTQADILYWLMEQRKNYSIAELEHPLDNISDVLALSDDIDEGDIITDIIRRNSACYKELQVIHTSLPDKTSLFKDMSTVRGVWLNKTVCHEIGVALGEPKINREQLKRLIDLDTDDLVVYENSRRTYALYDESDPTFTPDPEPTKRDEIMKQVAEDEGMTVPEPKISEADKELMLAQLEDLKQDYEQIVPVEVETSQEASYELAVITSTYNGYVTNDTPTEKVVTDIHDIVFPDSGNKATMPKVFPDDRETRGDYSKKSSLMVLDFDHLPAFTIQEVLDKLETLDMKMYVQESYRSAPMNFGIHVFFPMAKALGADEWNVYRDILGEDILNQIGLQYDTGHAGFRGVVNGSFHEVVDIEGEVLNPPAGLSYLVNAKAKSEASEPWSADRLTFDMYLGLDNKISEAVKDIFDTRDMNTLDGERNKWTFVIANDLVSMHNRNAFQNGVFDELWNTLADIITESCTPKDASEFLGVMDRAEKKLEI